MCAIGLSHRIKAALTWTIWLVQLDLREHLAFVQVGALSEAKPKDSSMPSTLLPKTPAPDLTLLRSRIQNGTSTALQEMERCIAAAQKQMQQDPANPVFLRTLFEEARAACVHPALGQLPLAGLAVSTKDLFDLAGQTTAAGSRVLADAAPAVTDCPAVARLKKAGGVVVGRTNMVEFAFSGVGVNPHFGTPANAAAGLDSNGVPRIPGGSSSGAAVSVANGSALVGLGSDTGGSIRIPAALNGIVGFKNTARLVPTQGAYPLSSTMDTVCALTRSVRDAILVHEILAARKVVRSNAPLAGYRLAVAQSTVQNDMDATVSQAFEATLARLRKAGATIGEIALHALDELPALNATGGFSPAEAYAVHYPLLQGKAGHEGHANTYDPRVLARIQRGSQMTAQEYIKLHNERRRWIAAMEQELSGYDAVLSPTVPIVAPPIAQVAPGAERDAEFFRINGLLLRNTAVVNMLDGCAISLPCHSPGQLPVGLMVWAPALCDDTVLNIARQIELLAQA